MTVAEGPGLRPAKPKWWVRGSCHRQPGADLPFGLRSEQRQFIRTYCRDCPVQVQCVEDVLDPVSGKLRFYWTGARGGYTQGELRTMIGLAPFVKIEG